MTTPAGGVRAGDRLDALQALRAVAALLVVLYHIHAWMPDLIGRPSPLWSGLSMGYAGVEIFFVLSGFIMFLVHQGDLGVPGRAGSFLWKRVRRIYPLLWVVLALTILARLATDGPSSLPTVQDLGAALLLWPFFDFPVIEVAWTLSFEMLFYLVLALTILRRRIGGLVAAAWFLATAIATAAGYDGPGAGFLLSPYNLLFLLGMMAAWSFRRLRFPATIAATGTALFLAVGLGEALFGVDWNGGLRTFLYGLGAMAMVAGLAALDRDGRITVPRWLVVVGDASYSIYLIHILAIAAGAEAVSVAGLMGQLPPVLLALILFLGAVATGLALYFAVERPLIRHLRGSPRRPAPAIAATPMEQTR